MDEQFVAGWKAARAYWESHDGSLLPYPPQPVERAPEPPPESVGGTPEPSIEQED